MYDEHIDGGLSYKPTLDSMIALAGSDAVAQLSIDFGGRRLYIPHKPGKHSPIAVSIGLDLARKIAQTYGGMDFTVPVNIGKRAEIRRLNEEGLSASEIARKVRCCASTVYRMRAEIENEKQHTLPL